MKNIVQVCHHPFPSLGGPAKTIQQFHAAVGARTIGFVAPGRFSAEKTVVPLVAQVSCLGGRMAHYHYALPSGTAAAEKIILGADMVLLHGLFTHAPVWAAGVCVRHGVPFAVALHGYLDPWALKKSRLLKEMWLHQYGTEVLARASAVICATRRETEKVAPLLPRETRRRVIPWACEVPEEKIAGPRREKLRRELGFDEADRVLVYFGRLHSMKRPLETLRLAATLREPRLKLLVVGPDEDVSRSRLEDEARKLHWDGLRVVGPVFGDAKFDFLAIADGYVSLSFRENFNYTLAEAMATGLPPILSPGNDLGWEFAEEKFSWQLKTDDPDEALRALAEFVALPAPALAERGARARDWARRNLSMDQLEQKLNELIREGLRDRVALSVH